MYQHPKLMTTEQIAGFRLQNQHITHPALIDAKAVVAWHGAMQAQDYAHSKWAVGIRLPGSTDEAIENAIDRGDIVRTHVLRPTWHLIANEDARWMLALSSAQIKAAGAARERELGLDEKLFRRCNDLIYKALEGGRYLTREEVMTELAQSGIVADSHRAVHIMLWAELDRVVCNGPRRGKQLTYALFDERVAPQQHLDRYDALAELARRYFTSHAPATLLDFQWWSGLRAAEARDGLESVKHLLVSETVSDQTYWLPADFKPKKTTSPQLHLLPAFDEFLVSYKDRSASLDTSRKAHAITGNGIFKPVITVDGRVKGVWQRTLKKDSVVFGQELFEELSPEELRAFEEAARLYAQFVKKRAA
jgi:hypothetical protein